MPSSVTTNELLEYIFKYKMKQAGLQGGIKHGKVKMKNKHNNQQSQSANEP